MQAFDPPANLTCVSGGYIQCTPGAVYPAGTPLSQFPTPFGTQLNCSEPLDELFLNETFVCPVPYPASIKLFITNACGVLSDKRVPFISEWVEYVCTLPVGGWVLQPLQCL